MINSWLGNLTSNEWISILDTDKYVLHIVPTYFIEEKGFENVIWKIAAILSEPKCVNNPSEVPTHEEMLTQQAFEPIKT